MITLDRSLDEDELMMVALEHGGDDLVDEGDTWRLTCEPTDLNGLREILNMIDILDDNDDVQDVYANFDMPDHVLQAAAEG